ncbi:calcium-binding EGF-like domain-containing protein [Nannocystis bainbridge]|uniref:EGF-like domain-containing protein n=1 Tax=Nannocystis bainbridge TaxID=2995303 RepID=A0ABT5DSA8_9BACT|nr:calcium-binding EGF-like domain-containing protein [Nannocystis bainbridge]MDC0715608.1 EGF-like domain-containing protein [Nannocystis bainbridge]
MNFASRPLSSLSLVLALAACGDGENPLTATTTATATDTGPTSDTAPQTTTGDDGTTTGDDDDTTTGTPDDPTTTTTTMGVDPCDACGDGASCRGDTCVCDEGFEGDGQTCTDLDECAGKNDCAVDATCNNTPGGYDCACNDGYKGNGFTCSDIDECTEDRDMCSPNAACANQDGGYKCTCNDGFTGDGFTCNGSKQFGESCVAGEECATGLCLAGEFDMCTVTCTQEVANDCGAQGVTGLCVEVGNAQYACAGDLTFGADKDDVVLQAGDKVARVFQTKTDADVFLVNIVIAGDYAVYATPDPDDDIQLDFYQADASEFGTANMFGIGQVESAVVTTQPGVFFVVARNIGASNGGYSIEVVKQ